MAEYIERYKLMDHIELNAREHEESYDAWQILGDVEDFPAANGVAVVRCKDCIHRLRGGYCKTVTDARATKPVNDNFFCSYGERRSYNAQTVV